MKLFILISLIFILVGCNAQNSSTFQTAHNPLLDIPGAFEITASDVVDDQVTVQWSPSKKVISYSLIYKSEADPGEIQTISDVTSPKTVTGLTRGKNYIISIKATNRLGSRLSGEIRISISATLPPGPPSRLSFKTLPSLANNADTTFTTQPVLSVVDSNGTTVPSYSQDITIKAYSDSACLTEVASSVNGGTKSAVNGEAHFTNLQIVKTNVVAIKAFTPDSLESVCLSGLSISPGLASSMSFTQQPAPLSPEADVSFTTQPIVTFYDAHANIASSYTGNVELKSFSDLTCATEVIGGVANENATPSSGVASFSGTSVKKTSVVSLKAISGSMETACLTGLTVTPGPAVSAVVSQLPVPSAIVAGTTFSTPLTVRVYDANANLATTSAHPLTVKAFSDASCTMEVLSALSGQTGTTSHGILQFPGLSLLKTSIISIRVDGSSYSSGCVTGLSVAPAAVSSLAFSTLPLPTSIEAGVPFTVQPSLTLYDPYANVATTNVDTVFIKAYADNSCGSELAGSASGNSASVTSGIADFLSLSLLKTNVNSIRAYVGGVSSECLSGFSVQPSTLTSVAFTTNPLPASVTAGTLFVTPPAVTLYDMYSNIITTDSSSSVQMSSYSSGDCSGSPVTSGLGGTLTRTVNSGIAAFTDLSLQKTQVSSIKAAIGSITACYAGLSVSPGAAATSTSSLAATSNVVADGTSSSTITVTLKDAFQNIITGLTPSLAVTGTSNTLSSCSATNMLGVSSCTLRSTKAETKTITFSSPTLANTATTTFIAGTPVAAQSSIAVGTGTANNSSGITVTITLKDAYANPVSGISPGFEILYGTGTYSMISPCTATDATGIATCVFKTFRGQERIFRISSPSGLETVMTKKTLTCSFSAFFSGSEGTGTSGNPYLISNREQLDQVRCGTFIYYKLMQDIDLAGMDWMTAYYGTSIGFDGNNKKISNVTIDLTGADFAAVSASFQGAAFFGNSSGWVGAYNVIKNVTFENVVSRARGAGTGAAAVCLSCGYLFDNVKVVNGLVEASDIVAGIVTDIGTYSGSGLSSPTGVTNSSFSGTVRYISTAETGYKYRWGVGGIAASVRQGGANITNNIFEGTLDSTEADMNSSFIGGIVAHYWPSLNNTASDMNISQNTVRNTTITSNSLYVGSLIGRAESASTIKRLIVSGNTVTNVSIGHFYSGAGSSFTGGLIGSASFESTSGSALGKDTLVTLNRIDGLDVNTTSSATYIGGIIGRASSVSIQNNYVRNSHFDFVFTSFYRYFGGILGGVTTPSYVVSDVIINIQKNYSSITTSTWNSSNTIVKGLVGLKTKSTTISGTTVTFTADLSTDDNYFNAETSLLSEPAPYLDNGLSTYNMQHTAFAGWNGVTIWNFQSGFYPELR